MASTVQTSGTTDPAAAVCTLDTASREARLREWQSLRGDALVSESNSTGGSVSIFKASPGVKRRIEALIQAENDCCSHLRFKLTEDGGRLTVEVTSAAEAD
jgi:hypothetical protein